MWELIIAQSSPKRCGPFLAWDVQRCQIGSRTLHENTTYWKGKESLQVEQSPWVHLNTDLGLELSWGRGVQIRTLKGSSDMQRNVVQILLT